MSEFDKLKDDAEQYAKDHPDQVKKAEQDAENKLGLPGQGGNQPGQDAQGHGQRGQGQGQGQGSADQGSADSSGQGQ